VIPPPSVLDEEAWVELDDAAMREKVISASVSKKWFKRTYGGDFLGRWILGEFETEGASPHAASDLLKPLNEFVYAPGVSRNDD
jgi:hypothetical protein